MSDRLKVVIDPGHGGTSDVCGSSANNATGPAPHSLKEKDITLKIGLLLRDRLSAAHDVTTTRTRDVNLSLADRAAVARSIHADVFLSIHLNGFHDSSVDGTETWVATQASSRSRRFAQTVLDRLTLVTAVANRGVRERNLGVLLPSRHDPGTACCLAEIAFLTNPSQASHLENPEYLGHIADALAEAVRSMAAAAVTHSVGGGLFEDNEEPWYAGAGPARDQSYAGAMSTAELERLYALPLAVTIKTVVDADARVRGGPPNFAVQGTQRIPRYTRVRVDEVNGKYSRVTGLDGTAHGWTATSNLREYFKDDAALASATLAPITAITIDSSWPETRKAVARTFNRLGGLMQVVATRTNTDIASVLAVWYVESGGRSHTENQAVIRLENHVLFDRWGSSHAAAFDRCFQFGTRAPQTGTGCDKRWRCHRFSPADDGNFQNVHDNQASEYRALAAATRLAGEDIALQCMSIGGPQILGSNFRAIGYETPRQMVDAFQAGEGAQVLGFFDFCHSNGLLGHLRTHNWSDFARGYNGSGQVPTYSTHLTDAYNAATAALATRPANAQALDAPINQCVDLHYPVYLIPQPDKLSCWAASMAMVLSYRRQQSVTPESLAAEVGRSLRTSYTWDMLRAVRQRFLFKEVSLPSNMSFVPPPSDWYRWLSQSGPLWVTVAGAPSHAVVVSGISGDLTSTDTYIHVLNPWDYKAHFNADPVDFRPANQGREETFRFEEFAAMFVNMELANYGDWRVLYLDPIPSGSQALDLHDLTPEEIADAEPSPAMGSAAVALDAPRRALGAADVHWADDDRSIDYRHLGVAGVSQMFSFTPTHLERLCTLNRFDAAAGQDEVLFALRGCELSNNGTATGWVNSADLSETIPDHKTARCILGVWKRSTGRFSLFRGSTVPNYRLMERYRQGGDACNMMPTGRYMYHVGTHRAGTPGEIRGAFREGEPFVVLRTLDDLEYEIGDTWDSGEFGDNIHPARLDQNASAPFFSSAGCQTVPGNVNNGSHTGKWAEFRAAAGLNANSPASENGRRFAYILLTARDARLAAAGATAQALTRLRFGSSGPDVTGVQMQLRSTGHLTAAVTGGVFDAPTKRAYINWQRARNAATADGVVTPSDGASLGIDMLRAQSIPVTHALDVRQPTNDEIIRQLDSQASTSYGSYAGYLATLVNGTVFGGSVSQVRPAFLRKLQQAETTAATAIGGASPNFGVVSIGGYRAGEGMHNWGLAVDLNYDGLPYIMHESGEAALDRELSPVYERIARFLLNRASCIPVEITQGNRSANRTSRLYDALLQESDAMIRYFQMMTDTTRIGAAIGAVPSGFDWPPVSGSARAPTASALQDRMMQDYVTLAGRGGSAITGKTYPAARNINRSTRGRADRPFATSNPSLRAPELGFLSIRKEVMMALSGAGLRWGAIDFGGESGDVMHFDDRLGEGAAIMRARTAAAAAITATTHSLEVPGGACSADVAVDDHTALLFSAEAPLANRPDCDHRAVWSYVPDPSPSPLSVLFYFHGNDACVTVDAAHPGGRLPSWNRVSNPDLHRFTPSGPFTPGLKYEIGVASQASRQHPVVLIPEDGVPGSWATTDAGVLTADRAAVSRLIDDCWDHLARLNRPSGGPYVSGGLRCPAVRRLFLAGHSGGGKPLGPSATSHAASGIPTDLWLLDCTHAFGVEDRYIEFCRHWKAQGKLGNDAQSSRMVVVVSTTSESTTNGAASIMQRLRSSWRDSAGTQHPGFNAVRLTQHKFCPMTGACPPSGINLAAGTEIVEVMEQASWAEIDSCLGRFPVVFIHSKADHDQIPLQYMPHLLNTAAVP